MVSVPQVVGEDEISSRLTLGSRATSTRAYGLLEDLELISEGLAFASSAGGEALSLVGHGNVDAASVLHGRQMGTLDSELCGCGGRD